MRVVKDGFKLKNDGCLEVYFIGVGSALATKNNQTNFLLVKGEQHVLVDCGTTGPQALHSVAGLKVGDIGTVLPTHSHADHIGGVESLALTSRYVKARSNTPKTKIILSEEYQRILWENSLVGGLGYNEEGEGARRMCLGDYFDIVRPKWKTHQPREVFIVNYGGMKIEMFRTKHIPEQASGWDTSFVSFGLFVDDSVFISGDTRYDPELVEMYADRSKCMFHDVQFYPGAVHAPLDDLKKLKRDWTEKMFLVHYSDNWTEQEISNFAGWTLQGHRYIF